MFFPLLAEKRTSFFHQRYFFLDCLHGMFHNFCLLTSEKRQPFALVLKTQSILKTIQKQSLNMRRAEISEKFSVTLWACLHNGNPAKQQLDELSAPAGQNKKVYAQKKQFVDNFFIGLGAFAPLPSATPYPEGKKKGTCFCRYLIGCVRSPAIFHKSRGAAPFFSDLRVILRGCRFAPLRSPFIGLGAFAPLPSATPYPEGKKKGTCINRYLIVLCRLNRCHGVKVNKIKGFSTFEAVSSASKIDALIFQSNHKT